MMIRALAPGLGRSTGGLRASVFAVTVVMSAQAIASAQQPNYLLRDQDCSSAKTLVARLAPMRVQASCSTADTGRTITFTVVNASTQLLRELSVGYCGASVIDINSPPGWSNEARDASVRWVATNDVAEAAQFEMNGMTGFSITLNPGWRLSGFISVSWLDKSGLAGSPALVGGVVHGQFAQGCDALR